MDFTQMILDAENVPLTEGVNQKVKRELDSVLQKDKKFQKMKAEAMADEDKIPDVMEYIYKKHLSDIESISNKYDIGFDDVAKIILT